MKYQEIAGNNQNYPRNRKKHQDILNITKSYEMRSGKKQQKYLEISRNKKKWQEITLNIKKKGQEITRNYMK